MREEDVKNLLDSFEAHKAQIQIWEKYLEIEGEEDLTQMRKKLKKQLLQVEIIERGMRILKEEEAFAIQEHFISKKIWEETYQLGVEKWGEEKAPSLRTLKRLQHNGLQKLLEFIEESSVEGIFSDVLPS